ncbi:hypothetical protein [Actinopolymorpha alba]|uniref:hypothetical protein n=1 Tax=Actinopolymorpha alba TaxID=533267 RepID=UPI00036C7057|nr:hypothetical protein [Actinopolymorpha alba]
MGNLDSLFTITSLVTLQGAAGIAWFVPNTLGWLIGSGFDKARKWVALVVALGLAFLAAGLVPDSDVLTWVIAPINGLLIFATAMGINQFPAQNRQPSQTTVAQNQQRFINSWA